MFKLRNLIFAFYLSFTYNFIAPQKLFAVKEPVGFFLSPKVTAQILRISIFSLNTFSKISPPMAKTECNDLAPRNSEQADLKLV